MSRRTHLWLLHRGMPNASPEISAWVSEVLRNRGWDGGVRPWYLPLLATWIGRWWWRRLLPPPDAHRPVEKAASKLEAMLGETWRCSAVACHGAPKPAEVAAGVPDGDPVLLVSLLPQDSAARKWQLSEAQAALHGRRGPVLTLPPLDARPGFVEACAEAVRAAIVDLPRDAPYAVVFYAPALANGPDQDLGAAVERTRAEVVAALGLRAPHYLGWMRGLGAWTARPPALRTSVRAAARGGARYVVLAPLAQVVGWLDTDHALRAPALLQPGVKLVFAEPPALRPTLLRDLADTALAARAALDAAPAERAR